MEADARGSVRRAGATWLYVLAPSIAWTMQFETVYVLVPPSRQVEHIGAIRWVSVAALGVSLSSAWGAWRELSRMRSFARPGERRADGRIWLARAAVATGIFFSLVIAAIAAMTWFLTPED